MDERIKGRKAGGGPAWVIRKWEEKVKSTESSFDAATLERRKSTNDVGYEVGQKPWVGERRG